MAARNFSVSFHTDVYDSRPWFQIPRAVTRLLGVKSGDPIAVGISKPTGEMIYHGLAKIDSGTEIYMAHIGKLLTKGAEIRVSVSRTPEDIPIKPATRKKQR